MTAYPFARVRMARDYMDTQIERLEREGKGAYMINGSYYLVFSSFTGPAITIRARETEPATISGADGYHYIEIDYPWIPFLFRPSHRI